MLPSPHEVQSGANYCSYRTLLLPSAGEGSFKLHWECYKALLMGAPQLCELSTHLQTPNSLHCCILSQRRLSEGGSQPGLRWQKRGSDFSLWTLKDYTIIYNNNYVGAFRLVGSPYMINM